MWLLTPRGFYSVVVNRHDESTVLVRARRSEDLVSLSALSPDLVVEHTPGRDYAWRTTVERGEWERLAAALASEIDYPNFKDAVAERQGYERASVYGRVWSALRALQAP